MAVNLTPLHDRVIVKRIEEKETVKGGIIIPDTAKEKPQEGEVIAVGAGQSFEAANRPEVSIETTARSWSVEFIFSGGQELARFEQSQGILGTCA